MEKKQIAIIGAGVAGLVACKYCLSKGFEPIVFEFESQIGGVWAKTIKSTRLQVTKTMYQFSDYPWHASVTDDMPTQQATIDYIHSYAKHFQLMPHINFHSRVKGISYDVPSSDSWVLWNGTGEPFPPHGKWNITVENTKTATTQVYTVDFVILCLGRNKDVPNMPKFPQGKGLDVFQGKAIHSLQYAALDDDAAEQLVKGKKVVVVGLGKSGLDIARSCAEINGPEHPCTVVYRHDHWKIGDFYPMGIPLIHLFFSRFVMLGVHKPEQGFLLGLIATLLSPVRSILMKLLESHIKITLPLAKYNMVPEQGLGKDMASGLVMHIPDPHDFFDALEKGSIKLKKTPTYSMYEKGISIVEQEEKTCIEADIVIFSTGFNGVEKVKNIFESPTFGHFISYPPRVGLYRECIHPRIPQLGIIGFSDGLSSLYTSEMRCKWLAALFEGSFSLPNINQMQNSIKEWDEHMKQASGHNHYRSFLGNIELWYNDVLCKDMGVNHIRKKASLQRCLKLMVPPTMLIYDHHGCYRFSPVKIKYNQLDPYVITYMPKL